MMGSCLSSPDKVKSKLKPNMNMGANLPENQLTQLLFENYLSIPDLVVCRGVCKGWKNLAENCLSRKDRVWLLGDVESDKDGNLSTRPCHPEHRIGIQDMVDCRGMKVSLTDIERLLSLLPKLTLVVIESDADGILQKVMEGVVQNRHSKKRLITIINEFSHSKHRRYHCEFQVPTFIYKRRLS